MALQTSAARSRSVRHGESTVTAEHFFETHISAVGQAWIDSRTWLDKKGSTLRVNGREGVVLVSPNASVESALEELELLCHSESTAAYDEGEADLREPRRGWPDGGGLGVGSEFDESHVVQFGVASVEVAEWLGMNLADAMVLVGIEAGDRSGTQRQHLRRRERGQQRKACPYCACGFPTVFVSRRAVSASDLDITIGQWRRGRAATWAETAWTCWNRSCDYREISDGTFSRSRQSIQI
jgi:hypothetical protein